MNKAPEILPNSQTCEFGQAGYLIDQAGGYGWTRTTDTGIMSAASIA